MEQLQEKPTENLEAYDHYIKGRSLFYTYDKSNNEQAIVHFENALKLDPSFSLAYSGLSKCYTHYINNSWDDDEKWLVLGEKAAKKAIELDDHSAEAYFALGFVYEMRRDYPNMEREMRNVLKLNPNHAHAHDSLGDVMHRWHGDLEEALIELNTALTLDPFLWPSYWNISDIYVKQGRYGDAEQILLKLQEKKKNDDFTLRLLGKVYRFMGKYEASIEMLKKALTINPQILDSHVYLGLAYLKQNDIDAAKTVAKFILEEFEETPSRNYCHYYLQGRIFMELGDFQSASQNFEKGIHIGDNLAQDNRRVFLWESQDIYQAIAENYIRQGNLNKAIMELNKMDDLPVGIFQYEYYMWALKHYKLGKIYEKMNDLETAKIEYEKFLDLWKDADPGIVEVEDARYRLAGLQKSP